MFIKMKAVGYKSYQAVLSYLAKKMKQLDQYPVLQVVIFSIALNLVLEMLSRRSIIRGMGFILSNPLMFFINIFIILMTLSVTLMFTRKIFLLVLISVLWVAIGVTNYILLGFRTTPLAAIDFYILKSVIGIIPVYLNTFQIILIAVIIVVVIVALFFLWKKLPKRQKQFKKSLITCCGTLILMFVLWSFSIRINVLSTNFGNLADAYKEYGFAYCFFTSIVDRGIKEPDAYSEENIEAVLEMIEAEPIDLKIQQADGLEPGVLEELNVVQLNNLEGAPNIIMVQLESFFDVNLLQDFTFSENPTPNFTQLKKDFSSGFLTVPSIGAGTANTEFEIITGMNIEYFGAGEYPYKTILQTSTCESICYNLDALGYHSHAIHNNTGTFYDRNTVFQKLGFDSFSSIEYMNNVTYNPLGWAKDSILTTEILKALNGSETADFIYTISVQPHGKYPDTVVDENQKIKVTFAPEMGPLDGTQGERNDSLESDLEEGNTAEINAEKSEMNVSNSELKGTKVSSSAISSSNVNDQEDKDKEDKDKEDKDKEDKDKEDIEIDEKYMIGFDYFVNQLAETDQFIGDLINELSVYNEPTIVVFYGDHLPSMSFESEDFVNSNKFQTEYVMWSNFKMDKVNRDLNSYQLNAYVMERLGYNNGILTKFHQSYADQPDYQDELVILQYDMLYGDKKVFEGENPYVEKTLQMGVSEIAITDVQEKGEVIFIEGENFTLFSVVYIDEEAMETLFIDENTLIVPYESLTGERFYVAQVTNNDTVLSQSKEWKMQLP